MSAAWIAATRLRANGQLPRFLPTLTCGWLGPDLRASCLRAELPAKQSFLLASHQWWVKLDCIAATTFPTVKGCLYAFAVAISVVHQSDSRCESSAKVDSPTRVRNTFHVFSGALFQNPGLNGQTNSRSSSLELCGNLRSNCNFQF